MKILGMTLFLVGTSIVNATYITTCHKDEECGTVCGSYGPDTIGASEGIFGTSCSCQDGQPPKLLCNVEGQNVFIC